MISKDDSDNINDNNEKIVIHIWSIRPEFQIPTATFSFTRYCNNYSISYNTVPYKITYH